MVYSLFITVVTMKEGLVYMKNRTSRLIIVFIPAFICLFLTGCSTGSWIDTVLNVNADLSGVRTMTVTIEPDVFSDGFSGTADDLTAVISSNIPKEMSYTVENVNGYNVYTFSIAFDSPAHYQQLITSMLNDEHFTTTIIAPTSVWANGFSVEENFDSKELLGWLLNAVVDAGFVSSSDSTYVFGLRDTKVLFNGEEHNVSSYIDLNTISYIELTSVAIFTDGIDDLFSRTIKFNIPQASIDSNETEIKDFLTANTPVGSSLGWENTTEGQIASITIQDATLSEIGDFTEAVFASNAYSLKLNETAIARNDFNIATGVVENIDLSNYASNSEETAFLKYYFGTKDNIEPSFYIQDIGYSEQEDQIDGYILLFAGTTVNFSIEYSVEKTFAVDSLDVETNVKGANNFTRSSKFNFDSLPSEEEQGLILERLTTKKDSLFTDSEIKIEVDSKVVDDAYQITITEHGTQEELLISSSTFYDYSFIANYGRESNFFELKNIIAFNELVDYNNVLPNRTDDFLFSYTVNLGLLHSIPKDNFTVSINPEPTVIQDSNGDDNPLPTEAFEASFGKVTYTSSSAYVETSFTGTVINIVFVLFVMLIIGGLVLILLALKFNGFFGRFINKENSNYLVSPPSCSNCSSILSADNLFCEACGTPVSPPINSDIAINHPEQKSSEALFCENCGNKLAEDAMFCEECGTAVEAEKEVLTV